MRGQKASAYSIQNVALEGLKYGKFPGDWYGVGNIAHVMEALTEKYQPIKNLKICVFQDGNLILENIELRALPLC